MIYVLTVVNVIILGAVAYLFYSFRKAVEASGVRHIDDYLHELEGSVAQLTEQFERSSTKISKDLLQKTTQLQALIGECDTKLANWDRLRAGAQPVTAADVLAGRAASRPAPTPKVTPAPETVQPQPQTGVPTVPPAVAARRMSASEALAKAHAAASPPPTMSTPPPAAEPAEQEKPKPAPVATSSPAPEPVIEEAEATPQGEPQPATAAVGQPNEKYRLIFLLASEGMDSASIAKHTNLTRGEVEMLLDLRRQGKI